VLPAYGRIDMAARRPAEPVIVGLIADTHALVRPEALEALAGVTRIVHAGDVGAPEVLRALARVAPVSDAGRACSARARR